MRGCAVTVAVAAGAQPADHGLFGPGSLTWRIMGEPVIWVAGCAEAKQALRKSYHPDVPAQFLALKLMLPPLNTLAFASLPRWARRMYGTPGSPLTDAGATGVRPQAARSMR